jgi:arginine/ornithine N-succinyltransferase beta subunit
MSAENRSRFWKKKTITGRDFIDLHQTGPTLGCDQERMKITVRCFKIHATGHARCLASYTSTETRKKRQGLTAVGSWAVGEAAKTSIRTGEVQGLDADAHTSAQATT